MTDEPSPSMKPQDTVIFLLGELGGKVTSLTDSVNSSAASQAAINTANEAEHAKFREAISAHDTAIAVLNDGKKAERENKLTRMQLVGLWIGAPSGVTALLAVLAYIFNSVVNK